MGIAIALLASCSDPKVAERLSGEIDRTQKEISEAEVGLTPYAPDSVLHALISLRLSVLKQTLSMLEQKRAAVWYYPRFSYSIEGEVYRPPGNVAELTPKLEQELSSARDAWKLAQGKAAGATGFVGALAVLEAEGKGLAVAQLEYQLVAYRNGFPPLYGGVKPQQLGDTPSASQPDSAADGNLPTPTLSADASGAALESEAMNNALTVSLRSKTFRPEDIHAGRYEDALLFDFEYRNNTAKDIRAFTGAMVFSDIFGREFLRMGLTGDDPIPAGQILRDQDKGLTINKFNKTHERLVMSALENLRVRFEPQSIIFSDGSQLGSVRP